MEATHIGSPAAESGDGSQGGGIIGKARERATAQLTAQKDKAIDGIGSVAQAVRQSTQQLRDQEHDTLAGYVERVANEIDRLSQQLRNKDVGELFEDAQRLARRQPALFIGSAFALGLIGARFLKSSSRHDDDYDDHRVGAGAHPGGDLSQRTTGPALRGDATGSTGMTGTAGGTAYGNAAGTSATGTSAPGTSSGLTGATSHTRGTSATSRSRTSTEPER